MVQKGGSFDPYDSPLDPPLHCVLHGYIAIDIVIELKDQIFQVK